MRTVVSSMLILAAGPPLGPISIASSAVIIPSLFPDRWRFV